MGTFTHRRLGSLTHNELAKTIELLSARGVLVPHLTQLCDQEQKGELDYVAETLIWGKSGKPELYRAMEEKMGNRFFGLEAWAKFGIFFDPEAINSLHEDQPWTPKILLEQCPFAPLAPHRTIADTHIGFIGIRRNEGDGHLYSVKELARIAGEYGLKLDGKTQDRRPIELHPRTQWLESETCELGYYLIPDWHDGLTNRDFAEEMQKVKELGGYEVTSIVEMFTLQVLRWGMYGIDDRQPYYLRCHNTLRKGTHLSVSIPNQWSEITIREVGDAYLNHWQSIGLKRKH